MPGTIRRSPPSLVTVAGSRVLGFATVAPGNLEGDRLPARVRRGLPAYPPPVLRLARLAVDEAAQGLGLGEALLKFVLRLAVRTADDLGCIGVLVDAKPGAVAFYERYDFRRCQAVEGESDERPRPVLLFLSIHTIVATLKDSEVTGDR